jgi:hypothetical protein
MIRKRRYHFSAVERFNIRYHLFADTRHLKPKILNNTKINPRFVNYLKDPPTAKGALDES